MSDAKAEMRDASLELDREMLHWLLLRWESLQLAMSPDQNDVMQRPDPRRALDEGMLRRRYMNLLILMEREREFDENTKLIAISEGNFGSAITETSREGRTQRVERFIGQWIDGAAEPVGQGQPVSKVRAVLRRRIGRFGEDTPPLPFGDASQP